jgi:hypothetical protein
VKFVFGFRHLSHQVIYTICGEACTNYKYASKGITGPTEACAFPGFVCKFLPLVVLMLTNTKKDSRCINEKELRSF